MLTITPPEEKSLGVYAIVRKIQNVFKSPRALFIIEVMEMKKKNVTAIILAAGSGRRMGGGISKQFISIKGRKILAYTVEVFEKADCIKEIILVTAQESLLEVEELAREEKWKKITAFVIGGKERQESVMNGLSRISVESEIIVIHDGVRPFITEEIIEESIEVALEMGACIVGVPVKDTIKVCNDQALVKNTPKRDELWQIQTPQTFQKELILHGYQEAMKNKYLGTDDSSVIERLNHPVQVITGSYKNIKITTQEDLFIAKQFLDGGSI